MIIKKWLNTPVCFWLILSFAAHSIDNTTDSPKIPPSTPPIHSFKLKCSFSFFLLKGHRVWTIKSFIIIFCKGEIFIFFKSTSHKPKRQHGSLKGGAEMLHNGWIPSQVHEREAHTRDETTYMYSIVPQNVCVTVPSWMDSLHSPKSVNFTWPFQDKDKNTLNKLRAQKNDTLSIQCNKTPNSSSDFSVA